MIKDDQEFLVKAFERYRDETQSRQSTKTLNSLILTLLSVFKIQKKK